LAAHDPTLLTFEYAYHQSDAAALANLLHCLEARAGGRRQLITDRKGSIVLDTATLEVTVFVGTGGAKDPILERYCRGALRAPQLETLSTTDRRTVTHWHDAMHKGLTSFGTTLVENARQIGPHLTGEGQERAVALLIRAGTLACYVVLNHAGASEGVVDRIPATLPGVVKYMLEAEIPEDATVMQLYFDRMARSWPYLLMPTTAGFGRFIDRYADLREQKVHTLPSADAFVERFEPAPADALKFLVNPFGPTA
jgi:hypothetical protein